MSVVSSNMITKNYCPQCSSFDLLRIRRNFVQKHMLDVANKLQCRDCGAVFNSKAFGTNIPIAAPCFQTSNDILVHRLTPEMVERSTANVLEPEKLSGFLVNEPRTTGNSPHSSEESEVFGDLIQSEDSLEDQCKKTPIFNDRMLENDHLLTYRDDFKVSETDLPKANQEFLVSKLHQSQLLHSESTQLVDETIFFKENERIWPYVLGSIIILFGAVNALIWMPLAQNDRAIESIQVDMSIGVPVPVESAKSVDIVKRDTEVEFQLNAPEPQEILTKKDVTNQDFVNKSFAERAKAQEAAPDILSLTSNTLGSTVNDIFTKTEVDLTSDEILPVAVPLLKTSVSQYLDAKLDQNSGKITSIETLDVRPKDAKQNENTQIKSVKSNSLRVAPIINIPSAQPFSEESEIVDQPNTLIITSPSYVTEEKPKPPTEITFDTKATAVLDASINDSKSLTNINSTQTGEPFRPAVENKPKNLSDTDSKLLEKVTIKLIQQDLDKLFPK